MKQLARAIRRALLYASTLLLVIFYPLTINASADDTPPPVSTDSTATQAADPTATQTTDDTTSSAITNNDDSTATSGDATVDDNTAAGDATSGDASTASTIVNEVNTAATGDTDLQPATFTANIDGDVQGDILLQPMVVQAMLQNTPTNTNVTATSTTQVTNNVSLNATSGTAAVTNNTTAGNATSGNATAVANVVNLVNSMVAAHQSFTGTININGTLTGDILLSPNFVPQLIGSNDPALNQPDNSTQNITVNDSTSIVNNVSLTAISGNAVVTNNTIAGNATSGNAKTNVVILNMTGQQVVASDSLLVFVNVLGSWVGMIVNAPGGATAAVIGDGVTANTNGDLAVSDTTNTQVINNVNVVAQTGNVTVTGNTKAGNATSGNASAAANIANIDDSSIGLSGWFGVLFINVFGNWFGSFGINTPYGNPPSDGGSTTIPAEPVVFVPRQQPAPPRLSTRSNSDVAPIPEANASTPAVLGAATTTPSASLHAVTFSTHSAYPLWLWLILAAAAIAGLLFAWSLRRYLKR